MRLGKRELRLLRTLGAAHAVVVPDRLTRRLVEKGLCEAEDDGSFCRMTPAGLRALADAADAGRITLWIMPTKKRSAQDVTGAEPPRILIE